MQNKKQSATEDSLARDVSGDVGLLDSQPGDDLDKADGKPIESGLVVLNEQTDNKGGSKLSEYQKTVETVEAVYSKSMLDKGKELRVSMNIEEGSRA
jgi:hypothetical protein